MAVATANTAHAAHRQVGVVAAVVEEHHREHGDEEEPEEGEGVRDVPDAAGCCGVGEVVVGAGLTVPRHPHRRGDRRGGRSTPSDPTTTGRHQVAHRDRRGPGSTVLPSTSGPWCSARPSTSPSGSTRSTST